MTDWEKVVRRHGTVVWQTAYRLLGRHADAADCYQEAFLSALEISRRERVRNWRGLLQRLATRRALDRLRRRHREKDSCRVQAECEEFASEKDNPVDHAQSSELHERLRKALAQLPPAQAEAFCLRHLEDLSYRQIARHLGADTNAVGVLLHRARSRLRGLLSSPSEQ